MSEASAEQFLDECGWSGPLRLGLEDLDGSPITLSQEFSQPFIVIGRRETADVTLNHPDVSRNHAYLQVIAGRVFCIDLLSRTGTHWENGRQPWGWIEPGSAVRVGRHRLSPWGRPFETRAGQVETEKLPISRSFGLPGVEDAVLELIDSGGKPSSAWWINRAMLLLGRSPSCKVHLPSPQCATVHASLVRTERGLWIVDMCSSCGTLVNGVSVRCARLADADEIVVGPFRLRILQGSSATRLLASSSSPPPGRIAHSKRNLSAPALHGELARYVTYASAPAPEFLSIELLREISRQQSDSAEQFRQMMVMFYQMHQEQMALVAGELDRLGLMVGGQAMVSDKPDKLSHSPQTSQRDAPSLAPLLAPSPSPETEPESVGEKRTERAAVHLPPNGTIPGATTHAHESSDEFHLVLAQRLAAYKDDHGRLRKLIKWLTGNRNKNSDA